MKNIDKYYENTKSDQPTKNVEYFIKNIKYKSGIATELGCGIGNDTIYLIKNNWKVIAIDKENLEERIRNRLKDDEQKRLKFQKQYFETIELQKSNLIIANYSLPFCNKNKFEELWNKIKTNIIKDGYFIGTLFGINDDWNEEKTEMTFLEKEQVLKLFKEFEIIKFKEIEKDGLTRLGKEKHWHIFTIIAKKIKSI